MQVEVLCWQAPPKEEPLLPLVPLPATSGKDAADDPFADPCVMQHASSMRSEEGADTQSHLSTQQSHHSTQLDGEGERRKTPVFKTKTVAPKLKAKGDFNKQILLWKQKQEELMPQDTNDGPSSLQLLEVSLLCLCIRFACSLLVLCLFIACVLACMVAV